MKSVIEVIKRTVPHDWRQALKRRLFAQQDMLARLSNLKRAGFTPNRAIDVGAFAGSWARECRKVWPQLPVTMIEPLPAQFTILQRLADELSGLTVISSALGESAGTVAFRNAQTNSGIATGVAGDNTIAVRCRTLDEVLSEIGGTAELIKIDVQGHELHVLKGGEKASKAAEVIILEVSLIRIGDVPMFREVDRFMEAARFRLYDVIPQYYRPLDGALWQADAFYVAESSPLGGSRAWD